MKKYALVTGACINTGAAIVEKFAAEGWNVVFTGRSSEKISAAKEKYPDTEFIGCRLVPLTDEKTVDEKAAAEI